MTNHEIASVVIATVAHQCGPTGVVKWITGRVDASGLIFWDGQEKGCAWCMKILPTVVDKPSFYVVDRKS